MKPGRWWWILPLLGLSAMVAGAGAVVLVLVLRGGGPAPVADRVDGGAAGSDDPAPNAPPPAAPRPPEPPAVAEGPAAGRSPGLWAVVVGIERYANDVPACNGAMADARAVRDWLVGTGGWPPENVLLLVDTGAEFPGEGLDLARGLRPTRSNLSWALEEWLPDRAGPEDLVVVSFAGQAAHEAPGAGAPSWRAGRSYLLPIEARRAAVERTGVLLDEALEGLASRRDNPIVCWLDTSLAGRGRMLSGPVGPPSSTPWLARLTRWPGVSAWLAADGVEAGEAPEPGRLSPFTAALLASLDAIGPAGALHDALARMQADPALASRGFRAMGGMTPGLGIRAGTLARRLPDGPSELVLQQGHGTAVTDLRFSAEGDWLVSAADREASVKIWDVEHGRVLHAIAQATNGVAALAIRPDKRRLVVGDGNGYLHAYDLIDGVRRSAPGPPDLGGAVAGLAPLPDGEHLAVLFNDEATGRGPAYLRGVDDLSAPGRQLADDASALIPAPVGADWSFALADAGEKTLVIHDRDGRPVRAVAGPGGRVAGSAAAAGGTLLAASDDRGGLVVLDATTWAERLRVDLEAPAGRLAVAPTGRVAVASGRSIRLFDLSGVRPVERPALAIPRPTAALACSPDGRWLAACPDFEADAGAPPLLWRLDGPDGAAEPVELARGLVLGEADEGRAAGSPASLAFAPDGSMLVAGDTLGGLRSWRLPDASAGPYQPPRRGQVRAVAVAGDGRSLLQVTRDGVALCWDLRDGRGPTAIPGAWTSGVILRPVDGDDGPRLAMTTRETASAGEVVLVDPATGRRLMGVEPPRDADGSVIPNLAFAGLVASADGRRIAAIAPDDRLAAVWDAGTGRPVAVLDGCHLPPRAVDLSADGRILLTAGDDGARIWELADDGPEPLERAAIEVLDDAGEPVPITSAVLLPSPDGGDRPIRVALGCQDGQIRLRGEEGPDLVVDRLLGAVEAMAVSADGRWLVAGGVDRQIRVCDLAAGPRPAVGFPAIGPGAAAIGSGGSHSEQVNALAFVRDRPVFVSGGDDGLVRLWRAGADGGRLLGSLSADQDSGQWVAYTPDGLFDCSPRGSDRVAWRWGGGLVFLDSYPASHRVFGLAGRLCEGDEPPVPGALAAPPTLAIDPPADRVVFERDLELTLRLDDPDPGVVRVYQDGVPVLASGGGIGDPGRLRPDPDDPRRWTARVRLHSGTNRFHAMAGPGPAAPDDRPSGPDGHSDPVEVVYGGADPDEPGLVHVVALGVGAYEADGRALRFATRDAEAFARFLSDRGALVDGTIGRCHLLTDREVTREAVAAAFEDVRQAVRGRPQDTVVLFLAGHADAVGPGGRERFFLILPGFPFPDPGADRDRAVRVALENRGALLPFGEIHAHLLHLDALRRLVVVDACQAEAIRADDSVRRIRELVDGAAYEARTSYYLAASRQGVPAGEAPELGHGLLTYALLKGLGMPPGVGPGRLPAVPGLPLLDELANADLDPVDGFVTTGELHAYVDRVLPPLARRFPDLALRAGVDGRADPGFVRPTAGVADAGFTLLPVPGRGIAAGPEAAGR